MQPRSHTITAPSTYGCSPDHERLQVRRALSSTGVLCTTGEHEYTRYGFRRLIADRAVDILQPDVTWCGGITEARRIVAQASTPSCGVHTARVPHVNRMHAACMLYVYGRRPLTISRSSRTAPLSTRTTCSAPATTDRFTFQLTSILPGTDQPTARTILLQVRLPQLPPRRADQPLTRVE